MGWGRVMSTLVCVCSHCALQLYDLDKEVAMEAIDILDEACEQEVRVT